MIGYLGTIIKFFNRFCNQYQNTVVLNRKTKIYSYSVPFETTVINSNTLCKIKRLPLWYRIKPFKFVTSRILLCPRNKIVNYIERGCKLVK